MMVYIFVVSILGANVTLLLSPLTNDHPKLQSLNSHRAMIQILYLIYFNLYLFQLMFSE